jgi:thiamine biosynthesis protein ThiS
MDLDWHAQRVRKLVLVNNLSVIANGQSISAQLPCSIEQFLRAQNLLPRSVVVEHNGEAVAPSEFSKRELNAGDRLEIVKIVAGG